MKMTKRTRQVLNYLQAIGDTTNRKALVDLGINGGSFTKRVSELVAMGYPISKTWKRHKATNERYVEYRYDLDARHLFSGGGSYGPTEAIPYDVLVKSSEDRAKAQAIVKEITKDFDRDAIRRSIMVLTV